MNKKPKILIVDDDALFLHMTQQLLLAKLECETFTAENVAAGIARAEEIFPDIIISDLRMPGEDGYAFCKKIKSNFTLRNTLFVLLSAISDLENKLQGYDIGADDYIVKPYHTNEFISRIRSLLRIKSLQDELAEERNDLKKANEAILESFEGIVLLLSRLISSRVPDAAVRGNEAVAMARWIGAKLALKPKQCAMLELAANIHEIGKIVPAQSYIERDFPMLGEALLKGIAPLQHVSAWIRHQMENFDGSGYPDKLMQAEIPLCARILRAINYCEQNDMADILSENFEELTKAAGTILEPKIANLVREYLQIHQSQSWLKDKKQITVDELCAGMKIAVDLFTSKGVKLLVKDTVMTGHHVAHIRSHHLYDPIIQGIYIYK